MNNFFLLSKLESLQVNSTSQVYRSYML